MDYFCTVNNGPTILSQLGLLAHCMRQPADKFRALLRRLTALFTNHNVGLALSQRTGLDRKAVCQQDIGHIVYGSHKPGIL